MNKLSGSICRGVVTTLIALPFLAIASFANAAGEVATITQLTSFGCAQAATNFDWTMDGEPATEYRINMFVTANGQTVMNEDDGTFLGSDSSNYAAYFADDYGPAVDAWPLPDDTIMNISMIMRLESDQSIVATGSISLNCSTGQIVNSIAAPVPVMPVWLLGLMGGLLSLLGLRKLRNT
jgi:hypothetical protein